MASLQILVNDAVLVQTLQTDQDLDSDVLEECLQRLSVRVNIRVGVPFQFRGQLPVELNKVKSSC